MVDSPIVQRLLKLKAAHNFEDGQQFLEFSKAQADEEIEFSQEDQEAILELGRLNWSPRVNWVERAGGLPRYIEKVAIGIMKGTGMPRSRAIPIAISRIKVWARGGGGVNADTVAKAVAALAAWTALKAKNKAITAAKKRK